nr:MAG TPA: restriction alleviation protein [Caudoviricetes sp.]
MSEELTLLPCPACGASDVVMRVDTRAYGFCHACGMCGPCAPKVDAEYAIRQWNSIPRALTWTTEPPKVPGWYWCRHKSYPEYAVVRKVWPEVWAEFGVPDGYDQWAGPIPEPREPKEQGGHDG